MGWAAFCAIFRATDWAIICHLGELFHFEQFCVCGTFYKENTV
jgi:hypothetical protein